VGRIQEGSACGGSPSRPRWRWLAAHRCAMLIPSFTKIAMSHQWQVLSTLRQASLIRVGAAVTRAPCITGRRLQRVFGMEIGGLKIGLAGLPVNLVEGGPLWLFTGTRPMNQSSLGWVTFCLGRKRLSCRAAGQTPLCHQSHHSSRLCEQQCCPNLWQ
jgi:hypothetical protein